MQRCLEEEELVEVEVEVEVGVERRMMVREAAARAVEEAVARAVEEVRAVEEEAVARAAVEEEAVARATEEEAASRVMMVMVMMTTMTVPNGGTVHMRH